ncbi:50S ribosomal protein L10 [Microbaculum marinum]|uniref:Large ribosomal subunit protein uL10 n=1 Tax=Microbaculum marinum TaxID=1764581 RepID=A0AAW9RXQ8_9HYPH
MDRAGKSELVTTLHDVFSNTGVVVVAHYSGLSVSDMTDLRGRMREAGGRVKVAKNRLARLALEGTEIAHVGSLLKGPTVIAYSDDPVVAPKIAVDFAKSHQNLVILGGAMGATALDPDGVKSLATLPSLDELRAKIVGMINTPATRVAQVLAAPGGQIARVLAAHAEQDKAA